MTRPRVWQPRPCIHGVNESACTHPDCLGPACAYCGSPTTTRSYVGTWYCSLECLCRYNAKKQARLPLED